MPGEEQSDQQTDMFCT